MEDRMLLMFNANEQIRYCKQHYLRFSGAVPGCTLWRTVFNYFDLRPDATEFARKAELKLGDKTYKCRVVFLRDAQVPKIRIMPD